MAEPRLCPRVRNKLAEPAKSQTAAVLLAAGESVRMGSPKPLLPWLGTTLIVYQIEQLLRAGLETVIVVLGHLAGPVAATLGTHPQVAIRVNPLYQRGKSTSIVVGVEALPPEASAILLLAVDQPRRAETLQRLVSAHLSGNHLITVPIHEGRRGHPPVLAASLIPELLGLSEETQGLRRIMNTHRTEIGEIVFDSEEVIFDLNTRQDYQRAHACFMKREVPTATYKSGGRKDRGSVNWTPSGSAVEESNSRP